MRGLALWLTIAPMLLPAQQIVVRESGEHASTAILREAATKPRVVIAGQGRLEFRRDTTISSTLIVIGRPTYLASRVDGDVIVIGSDLFLRPGVRISGRAIAIGGTVATTTLGRIAGGTQTFRDETFIATEQGGTYTLTWQRAVGARDPTPLFQLAGVQGLLMPSYDRVNGLSLPVGVLLTVAKERVEIEPTLTYRSARGALDPAVAVRIAPEQAVRFEGKAGVYTRSNDTWIYSNLLNSALSLWSGSDARNYFLAKGGEGRVFSRMERKGRTIEPFVGARYERVSPLGVRGVFSFISRDTQHIKRPNPAVESGEIGSALLGGRINDTSGTVISRLTAEVERSFTTISGTSNFTQLTLDGRVEFPTFRTQKLKIEAHAVTTMGDSVGRARYAYLGRSGTLPLLDMFEQGGSELLFVDSKYTIPLPSIVLPFVGSPKIILRHLMGAAGVRKLPSLEQEVGIGVGLSFLNVDYTFDAAGDRKSRISAGVSLSM